MQIEKNVPKPASNRHAKYPWQSMEVGDSVFFDNSYDDGKIRSSLSHYGKRSGRVYSAHRVDGGVRVWRDS